MKFKKSIILLTTLLIIGLLTLSVFAAQDKKDVNVVWQGKIGNDFKAVGLIGMNEDFAFFYSHRIAMEQIAKDNGFKATILDPKFNPTTYLDNIEQLIAIGVDAALVNSWDEGLGAAAVSKLKAAGIPTVILHVEPTDNKEVPVVNMDDYTGGYIVGEEMAKLWKETNPDVAPVCGIITNTDSITNRARAIGMKDAFLKEYPDAKLSAELDGAYTQEESMKAAEDLLTAYPDTNVWFTSHTVQGNGVLVALKASNKGNWPDSIIGCGDANPQNSEYLKDPESALKVGMGNSPRTLLEMGWEILLDYAAGKPVPLLSQYELKAITYKNIEEFVVNDFPQKVK